MKGRAVPANAPQTSPDGGNVLFNTVLFTGNANPALAQEMASHLGIELGKASVGRFSDGEVAIEIQQNVRARDIFVVQPTCAPVRWPSSSAATWRSSTSAARRPTCPK